MEPAFSGEATVRGFLMELRLANVAAAWESHVTGEVRLIGGPDEQVIKHLEVVLANPTDGPPGGRKTTFYMDAAQFGEVTVAPREVRVFPFTLRMGWGVGFVLPVQLRALAQSGLLNSPQVVTSIHALPPPEFTLVAAMAAEEARLSVGAWSSIDSGDGVFVTLDVGEDMRDVLVGLSLRMYRGGGTVYGSMNVRPRKYSLGAMLRTAAGLGNETFEFRLPREDVDATRAYFRETLRPYVDAVRHLPIPSTQPATRSDQLPVASHHPDDPGGAN